MYHFSEKYGYSNGKMYIALVDEKLAGCVALTKNDDDYCEIKRLYIREEFRGNHLGNMLSEKIIEDAGAIGYKYMRLDTVPFMSSAIKIYEKVGFKFIEKYNVNPASNAIFMQLLIAASYIFPVFRKTNFFFIFFTKKGSHMISHMESSNDASN